MSAFMTALGNSLDVVYGEKLLVTRRYGQPPSSVIEPLFSIVYSND